MALDHVGLFTILGKYVKTINTVQSYIASLEAAKSEIFVELEDNGLEDLYVGMPSQILSFQNAISGWITTLIGNTTAVLLDEDFVLDELPIRQFDVTSVLNGLYDYMEDEEEDILASVVYLGGADRNSWHTGRIGSGAPIGAKPRVYATRILDGVNNPGNNISAHPRYTGRKSEVVRPATITAEILSSSPNSETAQIFSELPANGPYNAKAESPGVGPTLTNVMSNNLIANNADFTVWTGDNPDNWTMGGGTAGTDWEDLSGTGDGPLKINTEEVTAKQQINGLQRNRMYFASVAFRSVNTGADEDQVGVSIRLENGAGTSVIVASVEGLGQDTSEFYEQVHFFFYLSDSVNLNDIFLRIEASTLTATDGVGDPEVVIMKAAIAPAVYYNGLGWAFFAPHNTISGANQVVVGARGNLAVTYNSQGVFQTFFRKAYNIQLPSDASPSIADSLAT